jgi:hypothetical protein
MIRVVHPRSGFIVPIPDPGVKKAPDPGSATLVFDTKQILSESEGWSKRRRGWKRRRGGCWRTRGRGSRRPEKRERHLKFFITTIFYF